MNGLERPTILVVDDMPDNLSLMSGLLKEEYKVKVANGGERALKIAETDPQPDMITLDIVMPGKSGVQVYEELRSDASLGDIPVFIVTGEVDFRMLQGLGGDTVLSVHVDPAYGPGALREALSFLRGLGIG